MNVSQDMKFGGINLENFISENSGKLSSKKRSEIIVKISNIDNILAVAKSDNYNVEEEPIRILEEQRTSLLRELRIPEYKRLDLEFLAIGNKVDDGYKPIALPKFGVYRYVEENIKAKDINTVSGFYDFSVEFLFNKFDSNVRVNFNIPSTKGSYSEPSDIKPIVKALLKSTDFFRSGCDFEYDPNSYSAYQITFPKVSEKLIKEVNRFPYFSVWEIKRKFTSNFRGLIPKQTKEKIKEAKQIFGYVEERTDRLYNVFLIAEVKPEAWKKKVIISDPLLVGKDNEKFFLVDKFNTTPLEDYVSREFIN